MSGSTLHPWLEQIREHAKVYSTFYCNSRPDGTMGWNELVQELLDSEETRRGNGMLITGPAGCGRHTLLARVIAVVMEKGYTPVFLTGEELADGALSRAEVLERMNAVLDQAVGEEDSLCLVLEQMEDLPCLSALLKLLERRLCRASNGEEDGFFLVLIQDQPFPIPAVLKGMLQVCRLQYPNRERRRAFFTNHIRTDALKQSLPMEKLLSQTEHFTYDELSNLVELLEAGGKLLGSTIPEKYLQEWTDGLRPEPSEQEIKEAFFLRVEQTLEQLPELLSYPAQWAGAPQRTGTIQPGEDPNRPAMLGLTVEQRKEKIKSETGPELLGNLFGKERVEQEIAQLCNSRPDGKSE